MVHMTYVPAATGGPESHRTYQSASHSKLVQKLVRRPTHGGGGLALGSRTWWMPKLPWGQRDERGAEMVEFAFVVVLLIALLYGIISYGLILAAQNPITQAAADGARAGIVATSSGGS